MVTKTILVDFSGMGRARARTRDIRKLGLLAVAMESLGNIVLTRDRDGALGRLPETWPTHSLSKATREDTPDLYIVNVDAMLGRNYLESLRPRVIVSHRYFKAHQQRTEERLLELADLCVTVRHRIDSPKLLSVPHIVSDKVLDLFLENDLLEAYLADDLETIRQAFPPTNRRRLAGFVGAGLYNRDKMAAQLPEWCECVFPEDDEQMPPEDYLRWLASCDMAIDFPGMYPKAYRFAEAVMLGVPVITIPWTQQPTIPISANNTVLLRGWDDHERLRRAMTRLPEIRRAADSAYRESWSLRAQARDILERFDTWARQHLPAPPEPEPEVISVPTISPAANLPAPVLAPASREWSARGQHNVLIIYDRPGWAYERRAAALQKHAPDDFLIDAATWNEVSARLKSSEWSLAKYDVVFLLDYAHHNRVRAALSKQESPPLLVVSFNADLNRRADWWADVCHTADFVICVNRDRFLHRSGHDNCCSISNGIDLDIFRPTVPIESREDVVLWCGSKSHSALKGYDDILRPLQGLIEPLGFRCDFRLLKAGIDPQLDTQQQVAWYNSGGYILCASKSEGTANTISEGVACGCVAISTPVGNIVEWGMFKQNCALPERTPLAFQNALVFARHKRVQLAKAGLLEMRKWDYKTRSQYFYSVFRRLIAGSPVKPFIWNDVNPQTLT